MLSDSPSVDVYGMSVQSCVHLDVHNMGLSAQP